MDLDRLFRSSEARLRLDLLTPAPPRLGEIPLRAPPSDMHPVLAASAFGYLLRFELERRHPHARQGEWLAEAAPERLDSLAPELAPEARAILAEARESHAHFVRSQSARPELRATMAAHALRLGRLDATVRAGYVDARMAEAAPEAVADLLAMLDAIPWGAWDGGNDADLAPTFGAKSTAAEALLLLDGRLVLVTTDKAARADPADLRRLVAMLILGRAARADVREVGILFARRGHLWSVPAAQILAREGYAATEGWLVKMAAREARIAQQAEAARLAALDPEAEPVPPPGPQRPPKWVKKRWVAAAGAKLPRQGTAKQKKRRDGEQAAPPPPPRAPKPPRLRDEPAEEAPRSKRPARPDWRKGSAWRKRYGK